MVFIFMTPVLQHFVFERLSIRRVACTAAQLDRLCKSLVRPVGLAHHKYTL